MNIVKWISIMILVCGKIYIDKLELFEMLETQ